MSFDDKEMPDTVDMQLSVTELALIYNLTARTAPVDVTTAAEAAGGDERWGRANNSLAQSASEFFNLFWEAGAEDVAPKFGVDEIAAQRIERRRPHDGI